MLIKLHEAYAFAVNTLSIHSSVTRSLICTDDVAGDGLPSCAVALRLILDISCGVYDAVVCTDWLLLSSFVALRLVLLLLPYTGVVTAGTGVEWRVACSKAVINVGDVTPLSYALVAVKGVPVTTVVLYVFFAPASLNAYVDG